MDLGATLIVGIDSEYQRADGGRNDVVCISFAALNPETEALASGVLPVARGQDLRCRPELQASLARVLSAAYKAGIIMRMPDKIVLAAHWSRADLPAFRDFSRLKGRFDSPRKTLATTTKPTVMWLPLPSGSKRVSITLVDTMLLAPAGQQSLAALGKMLDLPKIDLPAGAIECMREFSLEEPELFRAYAARDAEIAALYTLEAWRFFGEIGALSSGGRLPPTLGAAAVNLLRSVAQERGIDLDATLGYRRAGRKRQIAPELGDHLTTYAECFHGGRNEAYCVGYTPRTTLYDIDLCGAYSTALAHIRELAWGDTAMTRDLGTLTLDDGLGFARVRFRFPPGTRFPSLAVRAGNYGLVFPLEGVAWCTGFELAAAQDQGAELEVEHGVFVPWRSEVRPFAEFATAINALRNRYPKNSLMERLSKEMGNSLYGKVAQQVAGWRPSGGGGRHVFDSRSGEMRDMPASSITCAPLAAAVTGLVRATLSEILARSPAEHQVFSATTDGLLTTCPPDALRLGRVSNLFAEARELVAGDREVVEVKHQVRRALIWKTRGAIATEPCDPAQPGKPVIARAGHRLDPRPDDPWEECREWEGLYGGRSWDWHRTQKAFVSLREQHEQDLDLVDVERRVRVNLEFDMKRQLVAVRDVEGLLAAETKPWRTVEDFLAGRAAFDDWRRSRRCVLKATADHEEFARWWEASPAKRAVGSKGDRPALVTLFQRAWARRALKLPGGEYSALAREMSAVGFPTTVDAIKKARARGPLLDHSIDHLSSTDETFLRWALARWPDFEVERLVVPDSPAATLVAELRTAAVPVPLLVPGISASGTDTASDGAAQTAPAGNGRRGKDLASGATCAASTDAVCSGTRANPIARVPGKSSSGHAPGRMVRRATSRP